MNNRSHTVDAGSTTVGADRRRPAVGRVQHARAELAAAGRRERAQQRQTQARERREIIEQLQTGRGVTAALAALARATDAPDDHVRRALALREVLQEIDSGVLIVHPLPARKARRFLAFLEPEIAWLENVASGRSKNTTHAPRAA